MDGDGGGAMIFFSMFMPENMKKSIQRVVEMELSKDMSEFVRWAIADKLISIFKYPIQCPYCQSRNIIPVTEPHSSANFQCVDCANTWDEVFFRKRIKKLD